VIDSFPVPVCRFARAPRCQGFQGQAAFGHDQVARQTYDGFRAHLCIRWPAVITDLRVTPANVHDTVAAETLLSDCAVGPWVIATTGSQLCRKVCEIGVCFC
jgi:hypothetical protein